MRRAGKTSSQMLIHACAGMGNCLRHRRQRPLKEFSNLFISGFFGQDRVPIQNPPRIGVDYKNRMAAGIEQDGVGSLGTNAVEVEKFFTKLRCRTGKQFR